MSKSHRFRETDVRNCIRILQEVCDNGHDARIWRVHLLNELARLLKTGLALSFVHAYPFAPEQFRPLIYVDANSDPNWAKYRSAGELHTDPQTKGMQNILRRVTTRTRQQLCSDREWYSSGFFNEVRKPMRIDHSVTSVVPLADGSGFSCVGVTRYVGDRAFTQRDVEVLTLIHTELAKRWTLQDENEFGIRLPCRLVETLRLLCEGAGEKQIARILGLSAHTVHDYVKALHRQFAVSSTTELVVQAFRASRGRIALS